MDNQNNNATVSKSLQPPAVIPGAVYVGRTQSKEGRVARVEFVNDDGTIILSHYGHRNKSKTTYPSLHSSYRLFDPAKDAPVDWSSPAARPSGEKTDGAESLNSESTAGHRSSVRTMRQRASTPVDAPTVVEMPATENKPDAQADQDAPGESLTEDPALPEGHREFRYAGILMALPVAAGEPLVWGVSIANGVGYTRPRQIRRTVARAESSGLFGNVLWNKTIFKSVMHNGGERTAVANDPWLTELQSVALVGGRQTELAEVGAFLNKLADAFKAARAAMGNANGNMSHFGPDMLPKPTETATVFGREVPCYRSRKDFSVWVVGNDTAKAFGISLGSLYKKFASDGPTRSGKFLCEGSRAGGEHKWLARLDLVEELMAPLVAATAAPPPAEVATPHAPAPAPPADDSTIEEELGVSIPDGMMLANIKGVALAVPGKDDGEALLRDVTLGERLELSQPRDIRKTIKGMAADGVLGVVAMRVRQARIAKTGAVSGFEEREVTEYWLTEKQALKVIMRSKSSVAYRIVDEVTDVFLAWRHGRLPPAAPPTDLAAVMQMVPVIIEAVLARLPSQPASTSPDSDRVRQDAETLRRQRANAAKKATATKDVNAMLDAVTDDLAPLVHRFTSERMTRADLRDASAVNRCLRPSEMLQQFNAYLRAASSKLSAEEQEALTGLGPEGEMRNRVLYTLFNRISNNVKAEKEIEEDGEPRMVPVLPWIPKVGAVPNPRQTAIPGTGRLPIPRTPLPPVLRWAPGGSGAAPAVTGAVVPVPIAEGPQMKCSDSTTTNKATVPHGGQGFNRSNREAL